MKNFIFYTLLSSFAIGAFAIIDTLFYLKMGLDWQTIALLSSVLNITVLIAELPTGILADKVGVFKSVFIGTLLRALACFCYVIDFPYHFYVASILAGVGIAFLSGSINASIIKLKSSIKNNTSTEKIFANIRYYKSVATLLGGVVGFYLFDVNIAYAWVLAGVFLLISMVFLIPLIKQFNFIAKNEFSWQYLKVVSLNSLKTPIFWACVLFGISAVSPIMTWQVLFNEFDKGLLLGFLLFNTASLCASWILKNYQLSTHHKYMAMFINVLLLIGIGVFYHHLTLLAMMIFAHIICHSMTATFIFAYFHDNIADDVRNSLESLTSLLDSLLVIPIYLLTAYFLDKNDMFMAFLLSAMTVFLVFVLFMLASWKTSVDGGV